MHSDVLAQFPDARQAGTGWTAKCPAHDDQRASLSIGTGDDGRVLLHCFAGCSLDAILAAARLDARDLFEPTTQTTARTIIATYPYRDQGGAHLFDVVRYAPKDFRQRRADGVWSMDGVRRVLYRLPDLQGQSTAYVVEGEKDVDRLRTFGLAATCNVGGAGKWRPEYVGQLQAAGVERVVILPDHDEPGRQHAAAVAASCHAAGLQVKVVTLPVLPAKGDVSDWIAAGHTREELVALVKQTPRYMPPASTPTMPKGSFTLTAIGDLLTEPEESVDYIVEGCLAAGSINLLSAKPKVGKSTAARHLSVEVARGGSWLDRSCQQGPVWYLAFEGRRTDIRNHFRQLGASADDPLRIFTGQAPATVVRGLSALAIPERPMLIVIDTMQRFIRAKSTDDYAEMTTLLDDVIAIARDSDAAILLLHHSNKSGRAGIDAVLGSTAICGSMDTVFLMGKSDRYRTIATEQRTGQDMPEHVVTLDAATGRVLLGGTRDDADRDLMAEALVVAVVEAGEPLTQAVLEDRVEGRTSIKRAALKLLVDRQRLTRTGNGKKANRFSTWLLIPGFMFLIEHGNKKTRIRNAAIRPRRPAQMLVPMFPTLCGNRGTSKTTIATMTRCATWGRSDEYDGTAGRGASGRDCVDGPG